MHREKYPQHFKIKPEHLLFNYLNDEENQDESGHGPSSLQFFVYTILNTFSFYIIQFTPVATPLFLKAAALGIKCIQMLVSHISLLPAKQTQFKEQIWTSGSGLEFRWRKKCVNCSRSQQSAQSGVRIEDLQASGKER